MKRRVTTNSAGASRDDFVAGDAGSWNVAASWEGDADHEGAVSAPVSFTIEILNIRTIGEMALFIVPIGAIAFVVYKWRKRRKAVSRMIERPNCVRKVSGDWAFCPYCNARLRPSETEG